RFRYDVTLRIDAREEVAAPPKWVMWDEAGQWEAELERELACEGEHSVGLGGVRDGRVAQAVAAVRLLQRAEGSGMNAGRVRAACANSSGAGPDAVMRVGKRLGVPIHWQGFASGGEYEVIFRPQWVERPVLGEVPASFYKQYVNAPARSLGDARLGRKLR